MPNVEENKVMNYTGEDDNSEEEELDFSITPAEFFKKEQERIDEAMFEQEILENGWKETLPPENYVSDNFDYERDVGDIDWDSWCVLCGAWAICTCDDAEAAP